MKFEMLLQYPLFSSSPLVPSSIEMNGLPLIQGLRSNQRARQANVTWACEDREGGGLKKPLGWSRDPIIARAGLSLNIHRLEEEPQTCHQPTPSFLQSEAKRLRSIFMKQIRKKRTMNSNELQNWLMTWDPVTNDTMRKEHFHGRGGSHAQLPPLIENRKGPTSPPPFLKTYNLRKELGDKLTQVCRTFS